MRGPLAQRWHTFLGTWLIRRWRILRRTWWIPLLFLALFVLPLAPNLIQKQYGCDWTGFGECRRLKGDAEELRPEKTLWDWMGLLLVPTVLATAAYWFNRSEKRYELQIAEQRAQEATLQAYLDQMTTLLLTNGLRTSRPGDEVRDVARARTLTALRRLDKERRVTILRFLIESSLIEASEPIISFVGSELHRYDLGGANLGGANLGGANLGGANLGGAFLREANLQRAFLRKANLQRANLGGADLQGANLQWADLQGANLGGAFLQGASLGGADLQRAFLRGAHYNSKTVWPDGFDDATLAAKRAIRVTS